MARRVWRGSSDFDVRHSFQTAEWSGQIAGWLVGYTICLTLFYTLAPLILRMGAEEYGSYGTEQSKGTRLLSLSGHVERPGNYELPMSATRVKTCRSTIGTTPPLRRSPP